MQSQVQAPFATPRTAKSFQAHNKRASIPVKTSLYIALISMIIPIRYLQTGVSSCKIVDPNMPIFIGSIAR